MLNRELLFGLAIGVCAVVNNSIVVVFDAFLALFGTNDFTSCGTRGILFVNDYRKWLSEFFFR